MKQFDYKKHVRILPHTGETCMILVHKASGLQVEGETDLDISNLTDLEIKLFHELAAKVPDKQEPEKTESIEMSLEVFESHKKVLRHPMSRLAYNIYRGWDLPDDENGSDEGYLVEYLDGGKSNDARHAGYISWSPKAQFDNGYTSVGIGGPSGGPLVYRDPTGQEPKSLGNTDVNGAKKNVSDLVIFGNGDMFELICKASSQNEGWMKSTKGVHIEGVGALVQVTTQQGDNVAEALQFMPGVGIRAVQGDPSKGREFYNMWGEMAEAAEQKRMAREKNELLGEKQIEVNPSPHHKDSQ